MEPYVRVTLFSYENDDAKGSGSSVEMNSLVVAGRNVCIFYIGSDNTDVSRPGSGSQRLLVL